MNVESRMDEFKKVADKVMESEEEVALRMDDFEKVSKTAARVKEKESELPYGIRRYIPCQNCEEIMEIHEVKEREAIYRCHHCQRELKVTI